MNDDTNYLSTGLNKFFQRGDSSTVVLEDQASHDVQQISGSNLASGISKSPDDKLRVEWDNNRIVVNDGAIDVVELGKILGTEDYGLKLRDSSNTVFVDSSGIVGINTFPSGFTSKTNDQVLTGDVVFQDITGLSFTDLSFNREIPVLVFGMIYYTVSGNDAGLYTRISDGTNTYPENVIWSHPEYDVDATNNGHVFNFMLIINVPSGTSTIKVQCARSTPDETITVNGLQTFGRSTFGYLKLGT